MVWELVALAAGDHMGRERAKVAAAANNPVGLAIRFNQLSKQLEELEPKIDIEAVKKQVDEQSKGHNAYFMASMFGIVGSICGGLFGAMLMQEPILFVPIAVIGILGSLVLAHMSDIRDPNKLMKSLSQGLSDVRSDYMDVARKLNKFSMAENPIVSFFNIGDADKTYPADVNEFKWENGLRAEVHYTPSV